MQYACNGFYSIPHTEAHRYINQQFSSIFHKPDTFPPWSHHSSLEGSKCSKMLRASAQRPATAQQSSSKHCATTLLRIGSKRQSANS